MGIFDPYPWLDGDHLKPGEEDEALQIYRCAHCLKIYRWCNGGGGCTELKLHPEEEAYLMDCCDDCWCKIVPPMEEAYARAMPSVFPERQQQELPWHTLDL